MRSRTNNALASVALAAIAAGAIGCGDGGDDADSGPAQITPAAAPVYVDVALRPEGEAKENAEAALGRILDTDDPGRRIIELAEQEAQDSGEDLDYADDVEPWLGERFAVFLTSIGNNESTESQGAFVFETTDVDQALEFFKQSSDATDKTGNYNGVEYELDTDGDVLGAVDDFIVGGDLPGFKAAVDASEGDSLADSEQFSDAAEDVPDDSLATLYVPPEQFIDAVKDPGFDAQSRDLVKQALGETGDQPVLGDLTASEDGFTLEFSAGGGGVETEPSPLLGQVPASAWLGIGFGDIGGAVQRGIEQIEDAGIPGLKPGQLRTQVEEETGIDLEQIEGALGDGAVFVEGTSRTSLRGALIVQSKDEEASAELLNELQTVLESESGTDFTVEPIASATETTDPESGSSFQAGFQLEPTRSSSTTVSPGTTPSTTTPTPTGGLTQPIQVVQVGNRIVAGYGGGIAGELINAAGKGDSLGNTPGFEAAEEAVGELGIDAFVSFEPVLSLAESLGAAEDPSYKRIQPYLDALDFIAIGSGSEDDRAKVQISVGLKQP